MRKLLSTLALLALTATLTACGGGDAFQTPGSSGATGLSVAKVNVSSSVATLPPDGTTAAITVTATDANNAAVAGAVVTFATSAGTIAVTSGTTDSTGKATATLSASGVAAQTVITVTASTGSVSGKTTVTVANTQQALTLTTSVPQIPSAAGSSPALIKALVLDGSANVVQGVTVTFQATSGALIVTQGTTDANGLATATLSAGTSYQNRTITVTASTGASTATIQIPVIGTTLTLSGPTSLVQTAQGTYTATLADSGGTGIVGQAVTLQSANGNTISPASVTTDNLGTATFTLTATNAGNDMVTASAYGGSLVSSPPQTVSVSNQYFTLGLDLSSLPMQTTSSTLPVSTSVPVTVNWRAGGSTGTPQSGTVNFSISRGTVTAMTTDTTGTLSPSVTASSTTAGPATITASAVQGGVVVATAQLPVTFVAPVATAAAVSIQANPSRVPTQGQATVVATVVDATTPAPNPVGGATVNFTLTDPTGGQLSAASAVTNAQGQATVTYTATSLSSQPNGVTIEAQIANTAHTGSTQLTVGGQTVFLSLGTGNLVSSYSTTQYELPYSVQAADASGAGISGVTVTFSVQSLQYYMGHQVFVSPDWGPVYSVAAPSGCNATQVWELNGVITSPAPSPTTGYVLTNIPGSVATTDVSTVTTNAQGSANVNLIYPKDHALWVSVALTATATVSGTQNSTTATFLLPGAASDYNNQSIPPPGVISPYGQATSCYP